MSLRRPDRRARLAGVGRAAAVAALLALATGLAPGCTSSPKRGEGPGLYHVVQPGETVWRIARRYDADLDAVLGANGIDDAREVGVGTRLWIPSPADSSGSQAVPPPPDRVRPTQAASDRSVRELGLAFEWPVRGSLNSRFGGRGEEPHHGLDIGAPKGSSVRAAEAGKVVYADRLGDYGNLVIVKHVGDFSTVYAHNRKNRVHKGQFVEKGDLVAEVGTSGNASGSHLHFEIRQGQTPLDPLRYLP
jgi:lipoprotein NlpD